MRHFNDKMQYIHIQENKVNLLLMVGTAVLGIQLVPDKLQREFIQYQIQICKQAKLLQK